MDGFLAIYLNDQLALGVGWRELARRAAGNNRGSPAGEALERVATEIAEDVGTFRTIMDHLGVRQNPLKTAAVFGAERIARLKPNGRLREYSPLSRFLELEVLTMGIDGKKQLWTTLRDLAGLADEVPGVDFDVLLERAARQRAVLEPHRVQAGAEAFSGGR
ncbi:hypothetical protein GCM10027445_11250 [Amycolatopsis endophytica]|uniref:Uncharacterized protein n=1 Tax=Amycolatopsis endophytica TaxID=860233 RepID=A0A853B2M9_9PSEU|nr:hypothetical protein [Amycolatopsis endophytica]NYI89260.1 hypothetical protein [Amycolatopsis endophytica]